MQRMLLARECGDEVHGLDDMLSARWADLVVDPWRHYNVQNCGLLKFIDVDRPSGSLILCGGSTSLEYGDTNAACVDVFRYAEAGNKSERHHLVQYVHKRPPDAIYFSCGRWFPYDSAIFVTGTSKNGEVTVWDTVQFAPVTTFELGADSTILATEMSLAPGARTELIAVGRTDSSDLTLVDMLTGASTHRLQAHSFPLTGVTWAPINPHQVASVDSGGFACLFDIRRSGKTACLVQFNLSRRMPTFDAANAKRICSHRNNRRGERKDKYSLDKAYLLGLRCVWNNDFDRRANRKRRRSGRSVDMYRQGPPLSRARFSPDGSELITADCEGVLRVWDVFTGRLVRTHSTTAKLSTRNESEWSGAFEISRDGLHILCNNGGGLMALDAEDGYVVRYTESPAVLDMTDLALHPLQEEALSVEKDTITCWTPRGKNRTENILRAERTPALTHFGSN